MATVYTWLAPEEAQYLATNFPAYGKANGTNFPVPYLAYDSTTDEAAFWRFFATNYGSGNITAEVYWNAASATSGNVVWEAQIAAITPDTDSQDIETDGLVTLNFVQDTHLGTTAKRVHKATITISNLDSIASGDLCVLRLARDANGTSATDDMTGDAQLLGIRLSWSDA
jgi:hypothetical protein